MMRRKSGRSHGFGKAKLETRAHANRAFKRVTRQWELSMNIKCQIVKADFGPDCPNGGVILLMSEQELHGSVGYGPNANFPDAVRIKRIDGNLYFRPTQVFSAAPTGTNCLTQVIDLAQSTVYARFGLKKSQTTEGGAGVPQALNPLNNGATPQEISDYADARWLKMWEHVWNPRQGLSATLSNDFSCCSTQAGYTVPVEASGDRIAYNVPPVVCQPCGDVENPAVNNACTFSSAAHGWWHMRLRYGRTIVMKESDSLNLWFGWERMLETFETTRKGQPDLEFFGGVRLLLES